MVKTLKLASLILFCLAGCALAQDSLAAAVNPYTDPGMQDFVETTYGYRKNGAETIISASAAQPPSDLRDALSNRVTVNQMQEKIRQLPMPEKPDTPPAAPEKSAPLQEKELLVALNSPALCAIAPYEAGSTPKYQLDEMDYKMHTANNGSLAVAVPQLGEESCSVSAPQFVIVYVRATAAIPLIKAVESLSAATGFKPYGPDIGPVYGSIAVRGWVDREGLEAMAKNSVVARVISGMSAKPYAQGISAPPSDVMITLRVPSGTTPYDFLRLALIRLNDGAGFIWQRTVAARAMPLADGANAQPEYFITIAGHLPVDSVQRAAAYPFVIKIDAADLSAFAKRQSSRPAA